MNDNRKTKKQLIEELEQLREQVSLQGKQGARGGTETFTPDSYRLLIDNVDLLISIYDRDGICLLINRKVANLIGREPEDFVGRSFHEIEPRTQVAEECIDRVRKVIDSGEPAENVDFVDFLGGERWLLSTIHPIRDANGKVETAMVLSQDFTQRKLTEERLRAETTFSETMAKSMPGLLYVFEETSAKLFRRNANWPQITGYSEAELDEMTALDLVADRDLCAERMQEVYDRGHSIMENHLLTKTGEKIPYYFTGERMVLEGKTYLVGLGLDMSDRQRAEDALRESQRHLSLALQAAQMGTWEWDLQKDKVVWSPETLRIFGIDASEFGGTLDAYMNFAAPEDREEVEQGVKRFLQTSKDQAKIQYEHRIIRGDGEEGWIEVRGTLFRDDQGQLARMVGVCSDIADRKRSQKALKESEERFRRLAENAPDMIYRMSLPDGRYEYVSPASSSLFGYAPEEFKESSLLMRDVIHPDWHEYFKEEWEKLLADEMSPTYEYQIIHRSGEVRWMNQRNLLVRDDTGAPIAIEGIVTDITESKRAERELAESHALFQGVIEQSPIPMIIARPTGELTYNRACAEHLRFVDEPSIEQGINLFEMKQPWKGYDSEGNLISVEDLPLALALKGKTTTGVEIRVVRKDGSERWEIVNAAPIYNDEGQLIAAFVAFPDITERRRVEQALKESEATYRRLYDNAQIGLFRTRLDDGLFIDVNYRMTEMFGFESRDDLVSITSVADLYVDPDARQRMIAELKETGEVANFETPFKRKDGSIWWARFSGVLRPNEGEFEGFAEDITERKQAEELLESTNAFLDEVVNMSPFAMWVSDREGFLLRTNRALRKILDLTDEQLIGKYNVLEDENLKKQGLMSLAMAVFDKQEPARFVMSWNASSVGSADSWGNRDLFIDVSMFPIVNAKGEFTNVVCQWVDITEQKQAEEEVKKSRERFKNLSSLTFEGIVFHEKGVVIDTNESLTEILGYTRDELIGQSIIELCVPPEYHRIVNENVARQYAKPYEVMAKKKDGTLFPIEIEARNVEGGDFRVTAIRDITERRKAQAALRESEEKYRLLVENQTDLIVEVDPEGAFRFVSPSYCRLFGKTEGELLGKTFMPLVHEDDRELTERAMEDLYQPPHRAYVEQRAMTKGGWRWLGWQDSAILDENGDVTAIIGVGRDITDRKEAEEALLASERRHRGFLDNLSAGVVAHAPDTSVLYCNQRALDILGLTMDQMIGKTAFDPQWKFVNEDGTDMLPEDYPVNSVLAGRGRPQGDVVGVYHDDKQSVSWLTCNSFAVKNEDGDMEHVLITFFDITETKRLQELESRAQRLETAGRIAGQVAHDFNNLLGPLTAYPDLIRDELPRNHAALSFLGSMEKAAQQIADINQQLLTLGRRGHYNQVPLNLNEIVLHAVKELETQSETLVYDLKLAADIMNVLGGEAQIHRAISNLLNNARDAMEQIGTITVETTNFYADNVSVRYGRIPKGEYVKLTISDTGCGIAAKDIQRIFDPFYTSKSSDKVRGSGLGLSVVDAVVNDHDGYVDLRSRIGEGTSFYLYFPITRAAVSGLESAQVVGGTETVLVVDDDEIQRELSTTLLKKLGYKVRTVDSGEKAIEFIREQPQDILLLDMVMPPGIDGAETYKRVLEIVPDQKAIIVSGFSESGRVLEAQESGAGAFVKKPFTLQTIAAAVRRELDA